MRRSVAESAELSRDHVFHLSSKLNFLGRDIQEGVWVLSVRYSQRHQWVLRLPPFMLGDRSLNLN